MKPIFTTLSLLLIYSFSFGQVLVSDDFTYPDGDIIGNGTWIAHSGSGSNPIQISSNELVLTHGSGAREDINIPFGSISNEVYASFDFKIADLGSPISGSDSEYFAHFGTSGGFKARVSISPPTATGDFSVGVSTGSGTIQAIWEEDLSYDTNYKIILKYDPNIGQAQLWLDATLETDNSILSIIDSSLSTVDNFSFRQTKSSSNEVITIDNLIVANTFSELVLSVESTELKMDLSLYPNPIKNTNYLTIKGFDNSDLSVTVFNVLGQKIRTNTVKNNKLDISTLNSGIYFIRIKDLKGTLLTKKIIID